MQYKLNLDQMFVLYVNGTIKEYIEDVTHLNIHKDEEKSMKHILSLHLEMFKSLIPTCIPEDLIDQWWNETVYSKIY
jgi:hypothetical protein